MSFDPNALTFPPPEPFPIPSCHPKPLEPLQTPPQVQEGNARLPTLPSPPRKSLIGERYTLSTHLIPAAYPRTTPFIPLPPLPKWSSNKEEFKNSVQTTAQSLLDAKEGLWAGRYKDLPPNRKPMWICVNRYVQKDLRSHGDRGVTLFLAHANGFPKEIWEPMLDRLLARHSGQGNYQIDEIWSWEAANHGDACLVNGDALGGLYDWRDNSRDILQFLTYYLPTSVSPEPLPTHLPRVRDEEAKMRKMHGLKGHTMISIGHSFGGCTVVRAAIEEPKLFGSLYMIDAMIRPMLDDDRRATVPIQNFVAGAVQRRDGWSSREEAYKAFAAIPFFAAWDPAVLEIYVQCGLYEAPDGQIKLKMPGVQEAACFTEQYASYETFELLDKLDESIEVRWAIAGKLTDIESEIRRLVAWRRPANSSHIRILNSGHLIAQEAPSDVANDLHEFLSSRYGTRKALL